MEFLRGILCDYQQLTRFWWCSNHDAVHEILNGIFAIVRGAIIRLLHLCTLYRVIGRPMA